MLRFVCVLWLYFAMLATSLAVPPPLRQPVETIIYVIGDSLGDGLYSGLYRLFKSEARITVKQRTKISTGLARPNSGDWVAEVEAVASEPNVKAVIFMFGANDLYPLWIDKKSAAFGSERWRQEYGRRAAALMAPFQARGIKTYWVGIPFIRREDRRESYALINAVLTQAAEAAATPFFDQWQRYGQDNIYSSYGADNAGNTIRLRADDGIHFTPQGYIELARPVAEAIARDLGIAGH